MKRESGMKRRLLMLSVRGLRREVRQAEKEAMEGYRARALTAWGVSFWLGRWRKIVAGGGVG